MSAGSSYTLTTWPYYSASGNPPRTAHPITADTDEAALAQAHQVLPDDQPDDEVVGTLATSDGRILSRRYVIIHKADMGDGMRMKAGAWQFFAADDESAKKILAQKTVDAMNILVGPEGFIDRQS